MPLFRGSGAEINANVPGNTPIDQENLSPMVPTTSQSDDHLESIFIDDEVEDEVLETLETPGITILLDGNVSHEKEEDPEAAFWETEYGKILRKRLESLREAFRNRALQTKELVITPLPQDKIWGAATPPAESEGPIRAPVLKPSSELKKKVSFQPKPSTFTKAPEPSLPVRIHMWKFEIVIPEWFFKIPRPASFDPHSGLYMCWLSLVSLAFVYNAVGIPYRAAFIRDTNFTQYDEQYWYIWLIADYICDIIYIADLILWKPSKEIFVNGIKVFDKKEICRKYVKERDFQLDVLCLVPLDLLYLVSEIGISPLLRLPRLLKILSYWNLLDRIDQIATNPYYFRVLRSFSYMMYLIHSNACLYYYFSYLRNFDAENHWIFNNVHPKCRNESHFQPTNSKCTYPGDYNDYIFCLFFSVSMVTIIGNLKEPPWIAEIVYSWVLWCAGVFVFATIVGQIHAVLKAMTRHEEEFFELMDAIVDHMNTLKIPRELQNRVRTWLLFNWEQQRTIDERELLNGLPNKLQSDLAMEVHFSSINKVHLFKDVDKKVLEEVLLRLRPRVYLPGDYICRKGEIGKEMYIVKTGILEVVLPDGRVVVTLGPGSVFGEVSLLALAGGNRRTADVASKGYSNVYVLTKADLNDVMKDYPETLEALKQKAHELMSKGGQLPPEKPPPPPSEIIGARSPTAELLRVAVSVLKADSAIRSRLTEQEPIENDQQGPDLSEYNTENAPRKKALSLVNHNYVATKPIAPPKTIGTARSSASTVESTLLSSPSADSDQNLQAESGKSDRRRSQSNALGKNDNTATELRSGSQPQLRPLYKLRTFRRSTVTTTSGDKNKSHQPTTPALVTTLNTIKRGSLINLRRRLFSPPKVVSIISEPESNELISYTIQNDS